jgi:hypothetical protein
MKPMPTIPIRTIASFPSLSWRCGFSPLLRLACFLPVLPIVW